MINSGKITIAGQELNIFLNEEDVNKLITAIKGTTIPVVTTQVENTPTGSNYYNVEANGDNKKVSFVIPGSSGNLSYKLGNNTYLQPMVAPNNVQWDITVIDNVTKKEYVVKVDTSKAGKINFNNTVGTVVPETVITVPAVTVPTKQNTTYAEIGKEYFVKTKARLILPTRENSKQGQIFKISQNGKEIVSYDRPNGWNSESSYWGNHPAEWQPSVEDGTIDVYFKNTGSDSVIVGFTTGNKYAFYGIKGELAKTNFWKNLNSGQEISFSQQINVQKYSVLKNWNKTKTKFRFSSFFYEDGIPTTDKIICLTRENGLEITEEKETYKFYKESNPSKNITIEFTTRGEHQEPSFKVLHTQGLEVKPDYVGLTCYDVTEGKMFNNLSSGYIDSPDYNK